jgi:isopenicillin-N N-acyltransferase like protein
MLAKIGVNDAGLAVLFNILHHEADGSGAGVPVHAIARRILDAASTVDDALDIARSAPVAASSALTVAATSPGSDAATSRDSVAAASRESDVAASRESVAPASPGSDAATSPGSDAATLEVTPAGVGVARHRADGWLLHTNHLLDPQFAAGDATPPTSTTTSRLAHLEAVAGPGVDATCLATLAHDLCRVGPRDSDESADGDPPICVTADPTLPPTERRETLLTVRIDLVRPQLDYWPGPPSAVPRP